MKAQEAHQKAVLTDAEKVDASDKLVVMTGDKENGDLSRQDRRRAIDEPVTPRGC
jgi:hypothetical protein